MYKTTLVLFLVAASSAYYLQDSHREFHKEETKKDYNFDYTVHDPHTQDYHSHQESSKDGVVKGYYSVKDADGSLREVHYTADPKTGFKAIVTKNGLQVHPHTPSQDDHQESHVNHEEHHPQEEVEHHQEHEEELHQHHHEALVQHQDITEHHQQIPQHYEHIPEHHEHSFAVGLSSFHDLTDQQYHHEQPHQNFHHEQPHHNFHHEQPHHNLHHEQPHHNYHHEEAQHYHHF